jgi:FtsP/CotA-like multicopper oxidase with cupredoxin domain
MRADGPTRPTHIRMQFSSRQHSGERCGVLVEAEHAGVWAWHCHVLDHAESENGMFGMVTAMIVE